MAKMTKTQARNMLRAIRAKANRLWSKDIMALKCYIEIDKICQKYEKKL